MEKVIVTGANGFIGRNLITKLIEKNYFIIALDRSFSDDIFSHKNIKAIKCDLFNIDDIVEKLQKATYAAFFHLAWAATSGPQRSDYEAQLKNVKMTCDCVKFAKKLNCKKFIYASSINEIETYEYLSQNDIKPAPGYIYGTGKLAAHLMAETLAYQIEIEFIPVIITNIYGVGEKSARLINSTIRKLLNNEHCSFTAGNQTYDFIYIEDAINSIIAIATKGKAFNSYYIGSGKPDSLKSYLIDLKNIVDPTALLGFGEIEFNGKSIDYSQFELSKVKDDTGYINKYTFDEGIKLTLEYIKGDIRK